MHLAQAQACTGMGVGTLVTGFGPCLVPGDWNPTPIPLRLPLTAPSRFASGLPRLSFPNTHEIPGAISTSNRHWPSQSHCSMDLVQSLSADPIGVFSPKFSDTLTPN